MLGLLRQRSANIAHTAAGEQFGRGLMPSTGEKNMQPWQLDARVQHVVDAPACLSQKVDQSVKISTMEIVGDRAAHDVTIDQDHVEITLRRKANGENSSR